MYQDVKSIESTVMEHNYSPLCDLAVYNSALPDFFFKNHYDEVNGCIFTKLTRMKSK